MNYARSELGERLAAYYVLGLMPVRARRRFERAMTQSATLAALTAGWSERFGTLDALSQDVTPPARVWQEIERRIGPARAAPAQPSPIGLFWRGLGGLAVATCAAVAIYIAVSPTPVSVTVEALVDKAGLSRFFDGAPHPPADIGLSTMALGVSERERPRWLRAALLLSDDAQPLTRETPPAK